MKKVIENKAFSLVNISEAEMEIIRDAFTLLVRQTNNEMAHSLLEVINDNSNLIISHKKGMRKKRSSLSTPPAN